MDPAPSARPAAATPEDLLSAGRFDELYWLASRATRSDPNRARERRFFAGIAAAHLGLWSEARDQIAQWAEGGGHVRSGPRVSIVVDARCGLESRDVLATLAHQLYRPVEILVVRGPGEKVESVLEAFRVREEAPLAVRACEDSGEGWRSAGLEQATGDLVAFVDAGARLYPHHIGHLVALGSGRPPGASAGGVHRLSDHGGVETLPAVTGDRCELLVGTRAPLSSVLIATEVARSALGLLAPTERDDDGEVLLALAETAPFERSTLPTSSALPPRQNPAARLARTAARYFRHLPRATTLGGAALHRQRVEHLATLIDDATRDARRRARVLVALAAEPGDQSRAAESRLEAVTSAFGRAGERGPSPGIDIVVVDPSDANAVETIVSLCREAEFDYLAVVDAEHAASLEPGWLTGMVVLLDSDDAVSAALPPVRASATLGSRDSAERLVISGLSRDAVIASSVPLFVTRRRLVAAHASFANDAEWSEAWSGFLRHGVDGAARALTTPLVTETGSRQRLPKVEPPLVVLCYHRVVPSRGRDPFGIAVSRATFDAHLAMLQREFRVIGPDELDSAPVDDDPRPRVLVTLDDGYRDAYECAYPLLERHGIEAVVFATTSAISRDAPFWWEALDRSGALEGISDERRSDVQAEWRWLAPDERSERVRALVAPASELHDELLDLSATWDMLREMELQGAIRVGSHTRHHSSLGRLDARDLDVELEGSFADVERELGHRPSLFAFPHGSESDVSSGAVEALARAGCRYAFTTQPGVVAEWSRVEPGTHEALTLPRVVVTEVDPGALAERIRTLAGTDAASPPPKKIVVLSGVTANNLGDDAMLVATVRDLRRLEPRADITVLAESPERCATIARQAGARVARSLQCFVQDFLGKLDDVAHPTLEILRLIRRLQDERDMMLAGGTSSVLPPEYVDGFRALVTADGVVDCGGANLSAHWKSYFYEKCIDYLLAPRPLSVLGQGIDAFDDRYDQQLLVHALAQVDEVTLRESRSASYLESLGAGAHATTGDDALTLEPSSPARRALLLRAAGQDPNEPYVAFQYRHYLDYEDDRYLTLFAMFVDAVARATSLPVVGVPMHFSHTDERDHLERVGDRLAPDTRFHVVSSHLTAADAKALFAGSKLTFGISYHSAILALSSGVPYLGLYHGAHYEQKMRGLEELYEVSDLAVPIHDIVPSNLGERARQLLERGSELTEHLTHRHAELVRRVRDSRRRFLARLAAPPSSDVSPRASSTPVFPLEPVSRDWGFDRGRPVDRYYIDRFLDRNREVVRGRVLELLDDGYSKTYGDGQVTRTDVLDIDASNPRATIVDDLTSPSELPRDAYDCVILTQTLPYIYACGDALESAFRALAPGGTLLVTVPSIIKYHREPEDHWRFTPDSLARLVRERCRGAVTEVGAHGNLAAAASFLYGMAVEDLTPEQLEASDPEYPLVLSARITKPGPESQGEPHDHDR